MIYQQIRPIILASQSPRRQELLQLLGFDFMVEVKEVDEHFPEHLSPEEAAVYISQTKAQAFGHKHEHVVITADTIVAIEGEILGKPKDKIEARQMLRKLSGCQHQVFTGVTLLYDDKIFSFVDGTVVFCRYLQDKEIDFYIDNFKPFDKAGSYGVQDWFGMAAVTRLEGSYTNVMGLPTEKLYQHLAGVAYQLT